MNWKEEGGEKKEPNANLRIGFLFKVHLPFIPLPKCREIPDLFPFLLLSTFDLDSLYVTQTRHTWMVCVAEGGRGFIFSLKFNLLVSWTDHEIECFVQDSRHKRMIICRGRERSPQIRTLKGGTNRIEKMGWRRGMKEGGKERWFFNLPSLLFFRTFRRRFSYPSSVSGYVREGCLCRVSEQRRIELKGRKRRSIIHSISLFTKIFIRFPRFRFSLSRAFQASLSYRVPSPSIHHSFFTNKTDDDEKYSQKSKLKAR